MHIPQMGVCIETKDGIKPKARLVARGFEEDNLSEIQKDSPTCFKCFQLSYQLYVKENEIFKVLILELLFCKGIH